MSGPSSQYFSRTPAVDSAEQEIQLSLADLELQFTTDRGVFSQSRIDAGTRLLLQEAPHPAPSMTNVCDLGCGYGPIAVSLARRSPATSVWAVDLNERAVALTAKNGVANDCPDIHAVVVDSDGSAIDGTPEDVAALPTTQFDGLWSNPSIRIGKPAMHHMLTVWLDRLTPSGMAWLVVQRHLGADSLADWMTAQGWATTRVCSRAGYRLLEVKAR
ncbi:MAG: methyltransferase [Acidimicrobiia bacterium]|nr:methyltransferase [Acidimicrobiia bacterium]